MIHFEALLKTYGYLAVFIGTFAEGETILILAGFAAHGGYLALPWVILAAFIGGLCGDQLFFYLGRTHSRRFLARRPLWKERVYKAQRLLERFQTPLILGFRFLYGTRTVIPFVIGMSSVPTKRFILLNAISALIWASIVGTGGYLFGNILESILGNIKHYERFIIAAIAVIGIALWALHRYRYRKKRIPPRRTATEPAASTRRRVIR
jgi:membrane protein DedA with SNARE-associated domain